MILITLLKLFLGIVVLVIVSTQVIYPILNPKVPLFFWFRENKSGKMSTEGLLNRLEEILRKN